MASAAPRRPDAVDAWSQSWRSIPLAVWGSVITGSAAVVWLAFFEPAKDASITTEWEGGTSFLIWIAVCVGVVLGVRVLWGAFVFLIALTAVGCMASAVDAPATQSIVGAVLATSSLVLSLLGSVLRYETGRFRLFIERDTGTGLRYGPLPGLVRGIAVFLVVVWWLMPDFWR